MSRNISRSALMFVCFLMLIFAIAPACNAQTSSENQAWWEMTTPRDEHVVIVDLQHLSVDVLKQVIAEVCKEKINCNISFWPRAEFALWLEDSRMGSYSRFRYTYEGKLYANDGTLYVQCWTGIHKNSSCLEPNKHWVIELSEE